MPMLGQVLANNGFKATVIFSLDKDGNVDPHKGGSLSHSTSLDEADAIVMCIRFRHWADADMQRFENALNRGVPMTALRTSTHAFNFKKGSKWEKYNTRAAKSTGWEKGFGRQVLGESWVNHHGKHKKQGTRTHLEEANATHPVLNGVGTIFCTSDVYGANPLQPSTVLLRGAVTESLDPNSKDIDGPKNNPMVPVAWVREFDNTSDKNNRIMTTTMGASTDLLDENLRRLVINGVFWGLEMDVPAKADVAISDTWKPSPFSFKDYKKGLKPADFIVQ